MTDERQRYLPKKIYKKQKKKIEAEMRSKWNISTENTSQPPESYLRFFFITLVFGGFNTHLYENLWSVKSHLFFSSIPINRRWAYVVDIFYLRMYTRDVFKCLLLLSSTTFYFVIPKFLYKNNITSVFLENRSNYPS